jgi:polysaccharide pyruvyl transferase WcaK-like protein
MLPTPVRLENAGVNVRQSLRFPTDLDRRRSFMGHDDSRVIGLLDHMGYGNLGDAAVQDSVIANIKKRLPNARLIGFSLIPDDTMKRHGIPCHPILRWHPTLDKAGSESRGRTGLKSKLKSALKNTPIIYVWAKPALEVVREVVFWARSYRALRSLDLLIISGGGQLCELWGGPWSHPCTIFKFSLLTKLARKRLYFLNVGAGPLRHPLSRFFARCSVQFADYRSFRDDDSRDLVRSLGVKSKTHVYPDPAYALEIGSHLRSARRSNSKPIVGLNPIGFCDPRIWPRKDDSLYHEYLDKVTGFSVWLLEQGYNLRVFTTEISVDQMAIDDLRAQLLSRLSSDLVCPVFRSASRGVKDVLREMSEFDFVVTSKFHGIIFSHLLRKPVIALSYHRKMDVAMQGIGQGRFAAHIERFDVDWLINAFRSLVDESSSIKLASAAAVERYSATLSEQFDSLFLQDTKVGPNGRRYNSKNVWPQRV